MLSYLFYVQTDFFLSNGENAPNPPKYATDPLVCESCRMKTYIHATRICEPGLSILVIVNLSRVT